MKNKKILFTALALGFSLFSAESVYAATSGTTTAQVTISDGGYTLAAPTVSTPFPSVSLNGSTQVINATLSSFSVGDGSGTGSGWHVTAQASQFTEVGGSGLTLPLGSLKLSSPSTVTQTSGTASATPTVQSGAPWVIDNGSPISFLSAAAGTGMGNYQINFPTNTLQLTVGSNVQLDKTNFPSGTPFQSTITWTIVPGP